MRLSRTRNNVYTGPSRTRVNIFMRGLEGQGLTYMHSLAIFRHLKVELLTQFPPSNDEKYLYLTPQRVSGRYISDLAGQGLTYIRGLAGQGLTPRLLE